MMKKLYLTVLFFLFSSKAHTVSNTSSPTPKEKIVNLCEKIEPICTIYLGLLIMNISYKILRHPNCCSSKYQLAMMDKLTTFIFFSSLGFRFSIQGIEEAWKRWDIGPLIEHFLEHCLHRTKRQV